ncbi:MAG: integrase core domain-containing protein [Thermomicrobium sp.]|nr:integrase core domain-containing protein [Thermomicrobium sp.]
MDFSLAHGGNARLSCRHFGISPATFYRWWRRYDPRRLESLEDDRRTRRPHRVRQPQTLSEVVGRIRALRETYPRWGKAKLAWVLEQEGWTVSASTVGRTLSRLRAGGQLREPAVVRVAQLNRQRRSRRRRYAQRKPWDDLPRVPEDLVQIDSTPIEVWPGLRRIHFTATDVVRRTGVLAAYDRGSSRAAEWVLRKAFPRFGFPVRAIQIDGGSEFTARFEETCKALGIRLFVLPPRSPKLNGHVERAHRTVQEEFYDLVELPDSLAEHNALLQNWERVYNTIRPHQALQYRTPQEYVIHWQTQQRKGESVSELLS